MDLRKASNDEIANELARRDAKFILLLTDTKRNGKGAEMHCGNLPIKRARKVLQEACDILNNEQDVADDVRLIKRVLVNGKIVEEQELSNIKEVMSEEVVNEIGEYDPWGKLEATTPEKPPESPTRPNTVESETKEPETKADGNYDPWAEK